MDIFSSSGLQDIDKNGILPDDAFQEKLYEWFTQHIPSCNSKSGKEVESILTSSRTKFNSFLDAAYIFVRTEGITHYINQIDLGAIKYTLSTKSSCSISSMAGAKINVPSIGGGGANVDSSDSQITIKSTEKVIGKIGADGSIVVRPGKGEAVVGYKLLPISTLITNREIREVVQEAVFKYMNKSSEFQFIIMIVI